MQPTSARLLLFATFTFASAIAAQGPPVLAHWRCDETSGSVANDSGPLGNGGTLVNFGATPWVPGQLGNALQFDGVDDYVQIAITAGLPVYDTLGTPFSIAFWVRGPAQADRRVYSEQASAPTNGGPLFTLGSGSTDTTKLRVYLRADDQVVVVSTNSNAIVFDNTWHHVVYTDTSGVARIYVDGVLDKTFDYSRFQYGPASQLRGTFSLNSVTLGAVVRNLAIATPLNGTVDDLRIYRAALSLADVQVVRSGAHPALCAASIGSYGTGCGPGPLDLVATGSAALNATIWLQLVRGTPNSLAFFCSGIGGMQPLSLAPFGLPGCTGYRPDLSCTLLGALGPSGSSPLLGITVPNNTALHGLLVSFQGAGFGSAIELSQAALAQVGR